MLSSSLTSLPFKRAPSRTLKASSTSSSSGNSTTLWKDVQTLRVSLCVQPSELKAAAAQIVNTPFSRVHAVNVGVDDRAGRTGKVFEILQRAEPNHNHEECVQAGFQDQGTPGSS